MKYGKLIMSLGFAFLLTAIVFAILILLPCLDYLSGARDVANEIEIYYRITLSCSVIGLVMTIAGFVTGIVCDLREKKQTKDQK